jgi:hypothetical protein
MRRSLLTAALLASFLLPAFPAPAEVRAAPPDGPGTGPLIHPLDGAAKHAADPAAPARTRHRAIRCVRASLAELARRADFAVFAPRALPAGWVPAVCAYPPGGRQVAGLRIHFHAAYAPLPPAGALEPRIAGIAQTKAFLPELSDKHGKPVRLRGRTARFRPWPPGVHDADGRPAHGGTLRWIEQGTLIEIDSRILTKKQMIRLAESLTPLRDPTGRIPGPSSDLPAARPSPRPDP